MKAKVQIDDREFQRTLRQYMRFTRHDLASVVNTKALFIARGATRTTKKADIKAIRADLRANPFIPQMINKRRKAEGKHGLYGQDMRKAITELIKRRASSLGFIRAGWIPAIKKLAPLADKRGGPRQAAGIRTFGKPKGTAKSALPGWSVLATITNFAISKTDRGQWSPIAAAGLQAAFDAETISMKQYVARKLADRARRLGIKAAA